MASVKSLHKVRIAIGLVKYPRSEAQISSDEATASPSMENEGPSSSQPFGIPMWSGECEHCVRLLRKDEGLSAKRMDEKEAYKQMGLDDLSVEWSFLDINEFGEDWLEELSDNYVYSSTFTGRRVPPWADALSDSSEGEI